MPQWAEATKTRTTQVIPRFTDPPNNALQRTRAALSLQALPGEISASWRKRAALSFRTFGDLGTKAFGEP